MKIGIDRTQLIEGEYVIINKNKFEKFLKSLESKSNKETYDKLISFLNHKYMIITE